MQRMRNVAPEGFERSQYTSFVLVGDIGGTNARFSIIGVNDSLESIITDTYDTSEIRSPHEPINDLLHEAYHTYGITVQNACIAIAGPVNEAHSHGTLSHANITVDAHQLYQTTLLKHIAVVNDFEAVGHAIARVNPSQEAIWLQKSQRSLTRAVILGPGTGLGICTVYWEGNQVRVIPSEACDIHAVSGFTYDDLVSGGGLTHLYSLVKHQHKRSPDLKYSTEILETDHPAAKEAISTFLAFYGRISKTMALAVLPSHVFLVNGFSRSLAPYLEQKDNPFISEFLDGNALLKNIGVGILTTKHMGRLGAAHIAAHRCDIGVSR